MTMNTICIVDDDKIYQLTTKRLLERINATKNILVFSDGEEAYEYITEKIREEDALPDVIFLDINMPCMNAWEFLDAYNEIKPRLAKKIIIYIISSSISDTDIQRAKEIEHVKDYCVKPVSIDKYVEILKTA